MHRYDTDTERGWERGRTGRREFEERRWDYPNYERNEGRGYEGREGRFENRGHENPGYGDQGSWGQPYADEFRSQNWGRPSGRQDFGGRENFFANQDYPREYGSRQFRGGMSLQDQPWRQRGQFTGKGPRGYQRSDQRIQEEVNDRLTDHPEIDATEIEIKVVNGEVTLGGTVNERYQKRLAEDVVENIGGVKQVHNQMRVQQESSLGTQPQQQRKTAGSESPQQELTGTATGRR